MPGREVDRKAPLRPVERAASPHFFLVEPDALPVAKSDVGAQGRQARDERRRRVDEHESRAQPPARGPRHSARRSHGHEQEEQQPDVGRQPVGTDRERDEKRGHRPAGPVLRRQSQPAQSQHQRRDQRETDGAGLGEGLEVGASGVVTDRERAARFGRQIRELPGERRQARPLDRMAAKEPQRAFPKKRPRRDAILGGQARVEQLRHARARRTRRALQRHGHEDDGDRRRADERGETPPRASDRHDQQEKPAGPRPEIRCESPTAPGPRRRAPRRRRSEPAAPPRPSRSARPRPPTPARRAGPARWDRRRLRRAAPCCARTRSSRPAPGPSAARSRAPRKPPRPKARPTAFARARLRPRDAG